MYMEEVVRVRFVMALVKAEAFKSEIIVLHGNSEGRDIDDAEPAGDNCRLLQRPSPRPIEVWS